MPLLRRYNYAGDLLEQACVSFPGRCGLLQENHNVAQSIGRVTQITPDEKFMGTPLSGTAGINPERRTPVAA